MNTISEPNLPLETFDAIANTVDDGRWAPEGMSSKGVQMATMPTQVQRRHRTRGWALCGVTLVTILLVILAVPVVGHEAGVFAAKISQGLAH